MDVNQYKKAFDEYNGVIKLSEFTAKGFHNTILYKLIEEGYVEKLKTGYYEWIDDDPVSDAVIISKLFPEAVVCLDSALYIYGYSERTPLQWHLAVSKNKNKGKYKIDYPPMHFYFIIDEYMSIGQSEVEFEGHSLSIFDRDRTVCDIIRYEKKMDKEVFNYAIKAYIQDSERNISKLMDYAEKLKVKNKVSNIIGMWM